jgi:hypothetical protein
MSEPNPRLVFLPLIPAVLLFSVRPGPGYSISLQVLCPAEGRCAKSNPNRGARARLLSTGQHRRDDAAVPPGSELRPRRCAKDPGKVPGTPSALGPDEAQLRTEPRIRPV